jgi:hypothetical protein
MNKRAEYYTGEEWVVCKPLNKDCESIVNDLVNSVKIAQNWSEEKKQEYFYRAVSMACDMTTRKPKSKLRKAFNSIIEQIIHKFFCFTSKLAKYVH